MSEKHTPLPWHNDSKNSGYTQLDVCGPRHEDGGDYAPICHVNTEANADLIVAAVNSYPSRQRLVEALDEVITVVGQALRQWRYFSEDASERDLEEDLDAEAVLYRECVRKVKQARSALAEIGEKP